MTTRAAFDKNTATDSQIMQLIDEISVDSCRRIVLSHVIPKENLLLEDFARGVKSTSGKAIAQGVKSTLWHLALSCGCTPLLPLSVE